MCLERRPIDNVSAMSLSLVRHVAFVYKRKISQGSHRMANVHSGEEILPKSSTPLSRVHERYRQTDDIQTDRQTNLP